MHRVVDPSFNPIFATMGTVAIKIVNKSSNPLPGYATTGSSGMDIRADISSPLTIRPMERQLIPTGVHVEIPPGYEIQVRPRSGLAIRQGLTCLNSPGTIDADYRGEIKIVLINLSTDNQVIHPGDRIAQLVLQEVQRAEWDVVSELLMTERNEGGFGHTGKH